MITGYPSIEGAVEAVKRGAEEFLPKPFTDAELLSAVGRVLDKARLRTFGVSASDQVAPVHKGLIGTSEVIHNISITIGKASSSSANATGDFDSFTSARSGRIRKAAGSSAFHNGSPPSSLKGRSPVPCQSNVAEEWSNVKRTP